MPLFFHDKNLSFVIDQALYDQLMLTGFLVGIDGRPIYTHVLDALWQSSRYGLENTDSLEILLRKMAEDVGVDEIISWVFVDFDEINLARSEDDVGKLFMKGFVLKFLIDNAPAECGQLSKYNWGDTVGYYWEDIIDGECTTDNYFVSVAKWNAEDHNM
jgi:hypothetical protein